MTLRNEKVSKALKREISDILLKEIKDPSIINGLVSVTHVTMSSDNSFAKVYFSIFGDETVKNKAFSALEKQKSKIRYEIGKRIGLRLTPDLKFYLDDSLEEGVRVTKLIDKISKGEI